MAATQTFASTPASSSLLAARRDHVGRDVAAVDVQARLAVRDEQPAGAARHVERRLARPLDEAPEVLDLLAALVELGPPPGDEPVMPGLRRDVHAAECVGRRPARSRRAGRGRRPRSGRRRRASARPASRPRARSRSDRAASRAEPRERQRRRACGPPRARARASARSRRRSGATARCIASGSVSYSAASIPHRHMRSPRSTSA